MNLRAAGGKARSPRRRPRRAAHGRRGRPGGRAPRVALKHGLHALAQRGVARVGDQQLHVCRQQQALRAPPHRV